VRPGNVAEIVVERLERGEEIGIAAQDAAAGAMAPQPRLGDDIRRPGDGAAAERPQPLVEGDVDGIEECSDLGTAAPVEGLRLPDPRTVEMERRAARPCPLGELYELRPRTED